MDTVLSLDEGEMSMNYDRHCMRIVYYSLFELKQIEIEETRRASKYTLLGSYTAQKLWIIKNWNPLKYFDAWQWCRHSILYSRLSGEVWRYCIESVSSQFLRSEWVDRGVEQWWAGEWAHLAPHHHHPSAEQTLSPTTSSSQSVINKRRSRQ